MTNNSDLHHCNRRINLWW